MDGLIATRKNFPMMPVSFCEEKTSDDNLAGECRDLITVLSRKIETLCHECCEDPDRVKHIRSLAVSLLRVNSLLRYIEEERLYQPGSDVFEDTKGIRYRAVRNCDMERWLNEK
jgi:hypothetical protein